jgi:hypothetical protein
MKSFVVRRDVWVGGVKVSEADFPRAVLEYRVKKVHEL